MTHPQPPAALASHDPESECFATGLIAAKPWPHRAGIVASHGPECWPPMSRNIQLLPRRRRRRNTRRQGCGNRSEMVARHWCRAVSAESAGRIGRTGRAAHALASSAPADRCNSLSRSRKRKSQPVADFRQSSPIAPPAVPHRRKVRPPGGALLNSLPRSDFLSR